MQAMFDDNQNVSHLVAVCHEGQIAAAVVEGLDHQRVVGAVPQGRQILVTELCRNLDINFFQLIAVILYPDGGDSVAPGK